MNTADRSISLMDTALRRRFIFEEMMPKYNLPEIPTDIEGINCQTVLKIMNQRIKYLYDRNHTIGHSYFMNISDKEQLDNLFKNKIIPLLQEYFYDDWEKIQIILGDYYKQFNSSGRDSYDFDDRVNNTRFVQSVLINENKLLGFDYDEMDDIQIYYQINNSFSIDCYKKIYDSSVYKNLLINES